MALTFPLSLDQFFDRLPIMSCAMSCPAQVTLARTAGGEQLPADVGPQLWMASVKLAKMTTSEARPVRALLDMIGRAGANVMAYDLTRSAPYADPGAVLLGAATPAIASISADLREIGLTGLPAGYVLTEGDMIAFSYSSNPVRYALHALVAGAVADGSGATGPLEVTPAIREGATVGTAVTLSKPACKMELVRGSYEPGDPRHTITSGVSFQLIQTLR